MSSFLLAGPVSIDGLFGDAVFTTDQYNSTITRRLTQGLEVKEDVYQDGSRHPYVISKIRLGDYGLEIKRKMKIYENESYDVIFGIEFLKAFDVTINSGRISSPEFGIISPGSGNFKFAPKNFFNTDYGRDVDGRIILLFDMDCFEVQVHEQSYQKGMPRVVVNSSGRILAVSYEAKQLGINRSSTPYLSQALVLYPELIAIEVPIRPQRSNDGRPRPDTRIAREATARIVDAIRSCLPENCIFQFSSNDEFYVDITSYVNQQQNNGSLIEQMYNLWPNTFLYNNAVVGEPTPEYVERRLGTLGRKTAHSPQEYQELRLIYGSSIAAGVVREILRQTTYQSSVGIGSKKLISKVASGLHKPGSITILAPSGLRKFSSTVNIEDIPGLGGKFGAEVKNFFNVCTMYDLQNFVSFQDLREFAGEKKALDALNSAFGVDDKSVEPIDCYKTSGTTRNLYGNSYGLQEIKNILRDQIDEFLDKLQFEERQNGRIPAKIKMSIYLNEGENLHSTLTLENGQSLPNSEDLIKRFCWECQCQFENWDPYCEVDNLKIVAHF